MNSEEVTIRQYFQPIFGKRPRQVKVGVGSFLTFEFGPRTRAYGHLNARWRLWIYLSNWTLTRGDNQLLDSDADRDRIKIIAHRLEEETSLTDVRFDPRNKKTTFFFDDFHLLVSPPDYLENADNRDDYWIFFMPHNEVLAVGPSGIHVEQGNARTSSADRGKQESETNAADAPRAIRLED
jgi:hypothetical protein